MKAKVMLGFAVGPIGSAALGLITVPAITWLFSPADIGRLNVLQVTLSFSLLLGVLGLDQAYVREFHESPSRARLLKACFLPGSLLLLVLSALTLPFLPDLASMLYNIRDGRLALLTLAAVLVTYVSRFLSLILRMQERGWAYSTSQVLPKLLTLLLVLAVPVLGLARSFETLQAIVLTGVLAVMLVYAWNTRTEWLAAVRESLDHFELRRLLLFGLPLVASGLAYGGLTATSTFALRQWSTLEELAVYSVTQNFAGAAVIFQSIFATVWAPTVYKWVARGVDMRRVDEVARHVLVLVCLIFVAVGLFSWLTDLVLPPHYAPVKYLLACAIAPPLLYTLSEVTTVGIGITRRTGLTMWITLAAMLSNGLLSWWWVPRQGAAGAILANSFAFVVFFVLRTEVSARLWRQVPRARLYAMLGLMIMAAAVVVLLRGALPPFYPLAWIALLCVAGWFLRSDARDLVSQIAPYITRVAR